jgi:hypothetical protein
MSPGSDASPVIHSSSALSKYLLFFRVPVDADVFELVSQDRIELACPFLVSLVDEDVEIVEADSRCRCGDNLRCWTRSSSEIEDRCRGEPDDDLDRDCQQKPEPHDLPS